MTVVHIIIYSIVLNDKFKGFKGGLSVLKLVVVAAMTRKVK